MWIIMVHGKIDNLRHFKTIWIAASKKERANKRKKALDAKWTSAKEEWQWIGLYEIWFCGKENFEVLPRQTSRELILHNGFVWKQNVLVIKSDLVVWQKAIDDCSSRTNGTGMDFRFLPESKSLRDWIEIVMLLVASEWMSFAFSNSVHQWRANFFYP